MMSINKQERADAAREEAKELAAELVDFDAVLAQLSPKQKELALTDIANGRNSPVLNAAYERAITAVADGIQRITAKDLTGRAAETEIALALSGGI